MALQKREIIILAIIFLLQAVLFMLTSAKLISHSLKTVIFEAFIYFSICYLYVNRISTTKWRILISALGLCLIVVIISVYYYHSPRKWEFEARVIYGINTVAMVTFMMMNFTTDQRSTLLFSAFIADMEVLISRSEDSEHIYRTYTLIISIIIYILLSTFHLKQLWDQKWKIAAITLVAVATIFLGVMLRIYWHENKTLFIIVVIVNGCLSIVPWMWLMFAPKIKSWLKAYREKKMLQDNQYNFLEMAGLPTRFTIKEIETATANFQACIGEGASGAVYDGTLPDGSRIAVKHIKWQPSGEAEFRTEMTNIASRQHVNLVRLLGFCLSPKGDRYLIYPFLENGSLDLWLFTEDKKRSKLTWALRYQIAIDVAKALAYLHHECHDRILHLDIKPANILLDGSFRALLSDFGMSKLIGKDETSVMTKARGTVGYLAPEMLVPNAISAKSDIYSYGMVLLELVGGRRNLIQVMDLESRQRRSSYFPKIVREKMLQGELMTIVDKTLIENEEIREAEVSVLTRLALWCIQENPMLRPSMIEAVEMLEGRMPVNVPPESSMFVVNFLNVEPQCATFGFNEDEAILLSKNNFSISIQSGI